MDVCINSQSLQELKNKNNNRRNSPRENIQLVCWQEVSGAWDGTGRPPDPHLPYQVGLIISVPEQTRGQPALAAKCSIIMSPPVGWQPWRFS